MKQGAVLVMALLGVSCATTPAKQRAPIAMWGFETGVLDGWRADANWRTDDNSAGGWYSGWRGARFAWSGEGGEPSIGKLTSEPFTLEREGVEVWIAGWADNTGRTADRWNYVTLNLANGTELDRAYAPNATTFTPVFLHAAGHEGDSVYIEAVDDGNESTYSMICIDNVSQSDAPPLPLLPAYKAPHGGVAFENDYYCVEVNRRNGAITRIRDKKGGIEFIRQPRLAGNFKFTLPVPGEAAWQATEANYILGDEQRLASVQHSENGLTLTWGPRLENVLGNTYDVVVTMKISLVEDWIEFGLEVDNRTDLEIGEFYYPVLGGTMGIVPTTQEGQIDHTKTDMFLPIGAGLQSARIFHTFENQSWLGILGPEQHYAYPTSLSMPWLDFSHRGVGRGFYFGAHDPVYRYKVLHLEMFPGIAGNRGSGNWPRLEELDGLAAGVRIALVHMPYQPPRTIFTASPVVLRAHDGDWEAAARFYGRHAKHAEPSPSPKYMQCDAQPFERLAEHAAKARAGGRDALLLRTWRAHVEGTPLFEVAGGNEGRKALRDAIAGCHTEGVKVFFMIDIEPAAMDTPEYGDLREFASVDRWGVLDTVLTGSGGASHSQILANMTRRAVLNPASQAYREHLVQCVRELAALGGDGIHIGRFFGRALDFGPGLEATADCASWQGALDTLEAMLAEARRINPKFALTCDSVADHVLRLTGVAGRERPEKSPLALAFPQVATVDVTTAEAP